MAIVVFEIEMNRIVHWLLAGYQTGVNVNKSILLLTMNKYMLACGVAAQWVFLSETKKLYVSFVLVRYSIRFVCEAKAIQSGQSVSCACVEWTRYIAVESILEIAPICL